MSGFTPKLPSAYMTLGQAAQSRHRIHRFGMATLVLAIVVTGCQEPEAKLFRAIRHGDLKEVESLLRRNPKLILVRDHSLNGWTPLHAAASQGNNMLVDYLISMGANLEAKDCGGCTPLHRAILAGHGDTASLLIRRGADISARDAAGQTPPQLAFFFWHRTKSPDLFEAIKLMIAQTRNVNAAGPGGQTLLHLAALAGAKRAVELLIARGAKVTIRDENGNTPLDLAVAAGHEEVAEILRKAAAKGRNQ